MKTRYFIVRLSSPLCNQELTIARLDNEEGYYDIIGSDEIFGLHEIEIIKEINLEELL